MAQSKPISLWPCYWKVCVWGLAAHCLKASIQGRLVEKNVCFISYASNWQEKWQPSVQRPTFTPMTSRWWEFYRQSGRGVTCRNSTVIFKLVMSGLTSVILVTFNSFQSLSRVQLFATQWTTAHQASLSIINSWYLLKLMSIESAMPSKTSICCFRYSWSLVPRCTCSHVFVVSSQNCGHSSPGYSVVIM